MAKGFVEISAEMTDQGPALQVTDRFSVGAGISTDPTSALVRPYRRFLADRTAIGRVHYIFCREERQYYVLGALVHTAGGRIVFFPGTKGRKLLRPPGQATQRGARSSSDPGAAELVDHLTIDRNRRTWHVKLLERNVRYRTQQTLAITRSLRLWFQLQVRSAEELEVVPQRMEMRVAVPPRMVDLPAILQQIVSSRDPVVSVAELPPDRESGSFLGVQFLVSTSGEENLPSLLPTRINRRPHVVVDTIRPSQAGKKMRVVLEGFEGSVWIRFFRIPGVMEVPAFLISGGGIPKRVVVPPATKAPC